MGKRRLGRGLDSLISSAPPDETPAANHADAGQPSGTPPQPNQSGAPSVGVPAAPPATPAGSPVDVAVEAVAPNPYQPRKDFDESGLEDLMHSISSNGIIQPLVVRARAAGGYELVAGERRLRAALALGLQSVPVVVRDVPDDRMLELALVENIQRRDLNPIEKAEAFRDYVGRYGLTQERAAERIGIDRATLANHLRLLDLPEEIQALVRNGALGMSHARTIAGAEGPDVQLDLAKKVIRQGWSVRQTERTVQRLVHGVPRRRAAASRPGSAQARALEDELRGLLGTKVRVEEGAKAGSGRIVVEYYTLDDFDRIMGVIRR